MPTLQETADHLRIQVKKLRKLDKFLGGKFLPLLEQSDPIVDSILLGFSRGHDMTVSQCVELLEQPHLLERLGEKADRARKQLASYAFTEPAPKEVWAALSGAEDGYAPDMAVVIAWMKATIPDHEVIHTYLAVRLALASPANIRQFEYRRIQRVFMRVRNHPDFAGWYRIEQQKSRNVTWYHRPVEIDL